MVPSYAGRWQQSLEELHKASELDPSYWQPYLHAAIAWLFGKKPDRAADAAEQAVELSEGASFARMVLASAAFLAGRRDRSDEVLGQMKHKAETAYFPPAYLANTHLARGETDAAYECLVEAIEVRDPWLLFFHVFPSELTTTDSRFLDPLKAAGLGS
jgi:tetratricopeptide (TPR) repeat protein